MSFAYLPKEKSIVKNEIDVKGDTFEISSRSAVVDREQWLSTSLLIV